MSTTEREVTRNILKDSAGRAMFCQHPRCGRVLDRKRTVMVEHNLRPANVAVVCTGCADVALGRLPFEAWQRLTVTDGRVLWPNRPRAPRSPRGPRKVIKPGHVWTAKVSGKLCRVRVIGLAPRAPGSRLRQWRCLNLETGRECTKGTRALRIRVADPGFSLTGEGS